MVISSFVNEKSRKVFFFKLVVLALAYSDVFSYVCSLYALCLLLQILFVAALEIKRHDVPSVSSINSLLSQYGKASHFFFANFYVWGAPTVRFSPVVPWAKAGPDRTEEIHKKSCQNNRGLGGDSKSRPLK
jgi:hypothetical protein